MRTIVLTATALALAACSPFPETTLPFFGDGYRADGDLCRRIGEDAFTVQFLDDAADLVGCPQDMENLGVFVTETGAKQVALIDGYLLYSVPTR